MLTANEDAYERPNSIASAVRYQKPFGFRLRALDDNYIFCAKRAHA